jgi:biotin carboxyl carrier protein
MTFQFEIDDRERTVEVHRESGAHRVVVDGRERFVDAVYVAGNRWSLIVRDPAVGRTFSVDAVALPQNGDGSVDVYIAGHRIAVAARSGLGRRARREGAATGAGPQRIVAPMPGKIVRVLVAAGDEVQLRQGLVVVEAMKMENELRSPKAGRIKEVSVTAGTLVEAGRVLLVVE